MAMQNQCMWTEANAAWCRDHSDEEVNRALRLGIELLQRQADQVLSGMVRDCVEEHSRTWAHATMQPVQAQLATLQQSLSDMTSNLSTSSKRGALGESLVSHNVSHFFPDAEILDVSHQARQGDMRVHLAGGRTRAFIEVKSYAVNVPTSEVTKFETEFQATPLDEANTGIFVSCRSGIAKKQRFQIEVEHPDPQTPSRSPRLRIYLPNAGMDGGAWLVVALQFADMFHNMDRTTPSQSQTQNQDQDQVLAAWTRSAIGWVTRLTQSTTHLAALIKATEQSADAAQQLQGSLHDTLKDMVRVTGWTAPEAASASSTSSATRKRKAK